MCRVQIQSLEPSINVTFMTRLLPAGACMFPATFRAMDNNQPILTFQVPGLLCCRGNSNVRPSTEGREAPEEERELRRRRHY